MAERIEYTSEDLRDPFQSSFEIERQMYKFEPEPEPEPKVQLKPLRTTLPGLQVQGMVWSTNKPQAIINDTLVRIGDTIAGAEILDIRKEGVYVLYEERQYILRPTIFR